MVTLLFQPLDEDLCFSRVSLHHAPCCIYFIARRVSETLGVMKCKTERGEKRHGRRNETRLMEGERMRDTRGIVSEVLAWCVCVFKGDRVCLCLNSRFFSVSLCVCGHVFQCVCSKNVSVCVSVCSRVCALKVCVFCSQIHTLTHKFSAFFSLRRTCCKYNTSNDVFSRCKSVHKMATKKK